MATIPVLFTIRSQIKTNRPSIFGRRGPIFSNGHHPALGVRRVTEGGKRRMTESGYFRILEPGTFPA